MFGNTVFMSEAHAFYPMSRILVALQQCMGATQRRQHISRTRKRTAFGPFLIFESQAKPCRSRAKVTELGSGVEAALLPDSVHRASYGGDGSFLPR